MHVFKVVASLFIGIATSFGQRDLDFLLDTREPPVSVSVRDALSISPKIDYIAMVKEKLKKGIMYIRANARISQFTRV